MIDAVADVLTAPVEQYRAFVDELVRETDAIPAFVAQPEGEREPMHIQVELLLSIDDAAMAHFHAAMGRLSVEMGIPYDPDDD